MSDLDELYQSIILDHNRRPRNHGPMEGASRQAEGRNPLCGDQLTLWLRLDGDVLDDVRFVGSGCAISKASASLMTTEVKGKTRAEALALFEAFHRMVTHHGGPAEGDRASLGRLAAFAGVARFPIRVKCASLAWHALRSALEAPAEGPPEAAGVAPVTTE
jgi:nitrogen fixation NifU-like protein